LFWLPAFQGRRSREFYTDAGIFSHGQQLPVQQSWPRHPTEARVLVWVSIHGLDRHDNSGFEKAADHAQAIFAGRRTRGIFGSSPFGSGLKNKQNPSQRRRSLPEGVERLPIRPVRSITEMKTEHLGGSSQNGVLAAEPAACGSVAIGEPKTFKWHLGLQTQRYPMVGSYRGYIAGRDGHFVDWMTARV